MRGHKKYSHRLLQLAMAALLLRALVPAGFMAAPLAEGWPLQLCPSGMAMVSYTALLGGSNELDHGAHHSLLDSPDDSSQHHAHAGEEPDPACGLGAGYSAVAVMVPVKSVAPEIVTRLLFAPVLSAQPRAPPAAHRARAPPYSLKLS